MRPYDIAYENGEAVAIRGPDVDVPVREGRVWGRELTELLNRHARCVTGADVVPCELLEQVPAEVRDDINSDFAYDDEYDTPVVDTQPTLDARPRRR